MVTQKQEEGDLWRVVQGMPPSRMISAIVAIQDLMLCIIHDAIRQSPGQVCGSKHVQHDAAPCMLLLLLNSFTAPAQCRGKVHALHLPT
jgi:hypothetical protein